MRLAKHFISFLKHKFNPTLPYISARNMAGRGGGEYGYFDFIMPLHIISYKIITTVGSYTKFLHLVQSLK